MPSIDGKADSEEEDMDQDTPDSDKSDSRSLHSGSGSDEEESSELDEVESERRRNECTETMTDLELQFSELKETLYKEKLTQVIAKLKQVESGEASEYLTPVALLEENRRTRVAVAGIRSQLKQKNIDNVSKAEEQAAKQNYESEKQLLYDMLLDDLYDKIRRLEEDRHNVDITSDLFTESQTIRKCRQTSSQNASERRRKPVTVTGPYIVYMLRESEIREDWAAIAIAMKQSEEFLRLHDGSSQRGGSTDGSFTARFIDGKLTYEGSIFEPSQRVVIEARNSPPVQAKIITISDKAVTVRQSDGNDCRLFISQLQVGKYSIRHAT
jgi:breast cancer metastasis-suppressor 1-like protein